MRRRLRMQVRLTTLFLLITVCAAGLAWWGKWRRVMLEERATLAALRDRSGAFVFFAEQWHAAGQRPRSFSENPGRSLTDYLFARHALGRVVAVSFNANFRANLGDNPFTQPNYFQMARIPQESLDALERLPHLQWLDFSETAITDEQFRCLPSLPELEFLKMAACRNVTAGALEGLERFPRLRSINLTSASFARPEGTKKIPAKQLLLISQGPIWTIPTSREYVR